MVLARMKNAGLDATLSPYKNVGAAISLQQVIMVKPTTVDHILRCLEIARDSDVHVRPVGSGQSSSHLYPDEGHVLLDMLNYRNGLNEPIDRRVITIPPVSKNFNPPGYNFCFLFFVCVFLLVHLGPMA